MSHECILWCNSGTSDKLWGVTTYEGKPVSFWGRRGRDLRFKLISKNDAETGRRKKLEKDYNPTTFDAIEAVTPGFTTEFNTMLTMCILGDGFHRMHPDSE